MLSNSELLDIYSSKKLAVITDCIHYECDSQIGSKNHVLVKQFDELFSYFESVTICSPIQKCDIGVELSHYKRNDIHYNFIPILGGSSLYDKFKLISSIPLILKKIYMSSFNADFVYQRFPNNLNIPGLFLTAFLNKKTFATYTGVWDSNIGSFTYVLQKYLLKYIFNGPVHIYTNYNEVNSLYPSFSPSIYNSEWKKENKSFEKKVDRINKEELIENIKLINVGPLTEYKNQLRSIKIIKKIKEAGYNPILLLVGQGKLNKSIKEYIDNNNLNNSIIKMDYIKYDDLTKLYREAHFVIHTPNYEGYGKVIIEGMVYGCIPILSDVGVSRSIIEKSNTGLLLSESDKENINEIIKLIQSKDLRIKMMINGRKYCKELTIENWSKYLLTTIYNFYFIK